MGTLIEEIFSRRTGRIVQAGEILLLDVDYIMTHDNTTPLAIKAFREIGKPIRDKNKGSRPRRDDYLSHNNNTPHGDAFSPSGTRVSAS